MLCQRDDAPSSRLRRAAAQSSRLAAPPSAAAGGDMTSDDAPVNARRLSRLMGIVDGLPPLLRFARMDELVQTLTNLRAVVQNDERAWVGGKAAAAIDHAAVQALGALGRADAAASRQP